MIKPNFTDSNNWLPLGSVVGIKRFNSDNTEIPLSPLIFPLIVNYSTLAISVIHYPDAPNTWTYAGKASLRIRTGITVGGNLDSSIGTRKLFFNQINICIFPALGVDYSLVFYVPKWFSQIEYVIFGYDGAGAPDLETKLDIINQKIA